LFVDKGYGSTTIAEVASAAGVALETVYATFRNRPALLHRARDVAVGGDEQDVHVLDRPEMRGCSANPTSLPDSRGRHRQRGDHETAGLRLSVQGAAGGDSAVAALLATIRPRAA
jgi:AcrR family transcriptional regulator